MRSYRSLRRSRALRSRSATSYPVADGDDHAEGAQMLGHWFVRLVVMLQDILQTHMAIGAEQPIPEEIDHREIAVPIAVVDEMELLLSPEPGKAAKP